MSAIPHAVSVPERASPAKVEQADRLAVSLFHLAKLAALHDEATETALLANLWGRSPYAAALLTLGAALCASTAVDGVAWQGLAAWLIMFAGALAGGTLIYGRALSAPFSREVLQRFARELTVVTLFAGIVWGGGAFLVFSGAAVPWTLLVFAVGASAALGSILRLRAATLAFTVPVTLLSAAAAVIRPLPDGVPLAAALLLGGALVALLAFGAERFEQHPLRLPGLSRS